MEVDSSQELLAQQLRQAQPNLDQNQLRQLLTLLPLLPQLTQLDQQNASSGTQAQDEWEKIDHQSGNPK